MDIELDKKLDIKILLAVLPKDISESIIKDFRGITVNNSSSKDETYEKYEHLEDGQYAFILIGQEEGAEFSLEMGKLISSKCPQTPLFFINDDSKKSNTNSLINNGFIDCFNYPMDKNKLLKKTLPYFNSALISKRSLRPVRLFDIQPNVPLPFDTFVFLSKVNKFVKFTQSDMPIEEDRYNRLISLDVPIVFIRNNELSNFYQFTSNQILDLIEYDLTDPANKDKKNRIEKTIRKLFLELFDSQKESKEINNIVKSTSMKIVSTIATSGLSENLYTELSSYVGANGEDSSHPTMVSVIAVLLGIALNFQEPEDLAIAGFFHDISLKDENSKVKLAEFHKMNENEMKAYKHHSQSSLDLVKEKGVILNFNVKKMIRDHHERYDGSGFPRGLRGEKCTYGAQLISFADQLEYLTGSYESRERLDLKDALNIILNNNSTNPDINFQIINLLKIESDKPINTQVKAS